MPRSLKTASLSLTKLLAICLVALPFLTGCVELQTPLSAKKFQDDKLIGHWQADSADSGISYMDISMGQNGDCTIVQKEKNCPSTSTLTGFLTKGSRATYANIILQHQNAKNSYMIVQYSVENNKLHVWHTNFEKLKESIETKKIAGKFNETTWGQNMQITTPGEHVLKLLDASDGAAYFDNEIVFRRQTDSNTKEGNVNSMNDNTSTKNRDAKDQITATLQSQADAWNAGNLDEFMTAYLKSPQISFVSADGEMKGYEALENRYRKKYGTSKDTMGKLSFSDLQITELGRDHALCVGHWLVERADNQRLQGIFSLVLTKSDGSWKIIHDHTSLFPLAPKAK